MPWYMPWSESIKKTACRYLLQRYLGQFLEEKLTLDQLTVDLYNGTGTVSDVSLDVQALNELGEQQNFPVEFVDGYISEISVSIPWKSLLNESSFVEVKGLAFTIQPKQRADSGASMFESMWSSMTSSMQLAEECLKQGSSDEKEAEPLEGLELFAQTIDSILSRVKVKFLDTVIRMEHVPKDSTSGVAVEVRIRSIDYLDEAGADPPAPEVEVTGGETGRAYHIAAFTTKKFCLEGVTIYTDEFPSQARTFSRSVMSMSTGSTPDSKNSDTAFATAPASPSQSVAGGLSGSAAPNLSLEPDPILFGKLAGRHELRIKIKQGEGVTGPKVDLELNLGSLTIFSSPRQLHVLLELIHGLSQPDTVDTSNVAPRHRCAEKPMDPSDFQRVEQELQQHVHGLSPLQSKGLHNAQAWSSADLDESDDEFLPMKNGNSNLSESVLSSATSMDASISSSISGATSSCSGKDLLGKLSDSPYRQSASSNRYKRKSKGSGSSGGADVDPSAEVSHFQVRLGSLAVILLHEDVLTLSVDLDGTSLARSSVFQMKALASSFFDKLGLFSVSAMGGAQAFDEARNVFLDAVQRNHIRLLSTALILDGREKTTIHNSSFSGQITSASMEVLECLVEKNSPSQNCTTAEYVELLKFVHGLDCEANTSVPYAQRSQPDFRLNFQYTERLSGVPSRKSAQPRTEIGIVLEPCCSELDISIVDRITAVLNPEPMCCRGTSKGPNADLWKCKRESSLAEVLDNRCQSDGRTEIKVSTPSIVIKLRFPIPDLRPIHDMDRPPWWKRCVREDFLLLNLSEASFQTVVDSKDICSTYEFQFKDGHGLFQEGDSESPIPILRAHADEKSGQSLPNDGEGFGWPRVVLRCYPSQVLGDLEDLPTVHPEESISYSSMDLLKNAAYKDPSPFSSKRVVHESDTPHGKASCPTQEGEELIIPGNQKEINDFIRFATQSSQLQFEIHLPCASVQFPSKHMFELVYNRLSTDLLLWAPSAPKPKGVPPTVVQDLSSFPNFSPYPGFSMCKSGIQYESDFDSIDDAENDTGMFYSVLESRHRLKSVRQNVGSARGGVPYGQSQASVTISVGQGAFSIFTPVRDSADKVIPGQQGEFLVQLDEGTMFLVSQYRGSPKLSYLCVQANRAAVYHNGIGPVPTSCPSLFTVGAMPGAHLFPTLYRSENGVLAANTSASVGVGSRNSLDMVTVALRIQIEEGTHYVKTFRVAVGVRGTTLRHKMSTSGHSWFKQLTDFFDILDYPVAGYERPCVITELHLHFWDSAIDYRPLYLPLKSMLTIGSLSLSSNIAAQTKTSTLRFMAEDACLLLAEKSGSSSGVTVDLCKDYVCVLEIGLFELSLRLSDKTNGSGPRVDLRASNNIVHIRTCPDSARALTDLLSYFAGDGDLISQADCQTSYSSGSRPWGSESMSSNRTNSSSATLRDEPPVSPARSHSRGDRDTLIQLDGADGTQPALSAKQVHHVHSLMEEAMLDTSGHSTPLVSASPLSLKNNDAVEVYYFPDESQKSKAEEIEEAIGDGGVSRVAMEHPEMNQVVMDEDEADDDWDEEFCILEEETGNGIPPRSGLPEVRALVPEPIHVLENHFSVPQGKADLLKPPKHYPVPVMRYTLREMSVVWHMYGGHDFGPAKGSNQTPVPKKRVHISDGTESHGSSPQSTMRNHCSSPEIGPGIVAFSKSNPQEVRFSAVNAVSANAVSPSPGSPSLSNPPMTWQVKGGPGRKHDTLMELQLNKVRFQHEIYPENTVEASRQVLLINEIEVRDRLASSEINKFLYQYSSEARPKQSHANMLVLKALHVRPDPKLTAQECCLKVSLLPIRLNIDQDSLLFLYSFFSEISGNQDDDEEGAQSSTPRLATPTHQHSHQPPVMTVNINDGQSVILPTDQSTLLIQLEETDALAGLREGFSHQTSGVDGFTSAPTDSSENQPPAPPIYFRSFVFTPEVPIRLDYQGKHVDMTHGPLAGLLMGLGQLSCSELKLKRLSHRHGLLGFDKLMAYALLEWLQDIKKNQLPSLLGGVGPMHSLVQLFQGIRDLFWLPIEQYQKDGRIVRGLQRGANSFTTSTAMAALELTSRLVQAIQCTAETAYDMLSPGPSVRQRSISGKGKGQRRKRNNQPLDIREGMHNAYNVVKEGISETAENVVRVASEEHEQKGMTGAVGGVLRQIPGLAVKPVIFVSEATHNVLGGMRSQLKPDARREAVEKWRSED